MVVQMQIRGSQCEKLVGTLLDNFPGTPTGSVPRVLGPWTVW